MAEDKRYYWLKLNENFFEDDTIAWLEEQENGKDYVIFYLKLCLKSLQDDGKLIRYVGESLIPYDITALSKLTATHVDTVRTAMNIFIKIGLIEQLETGEIYMKQINEMIGTETDVAKRVRKHRAQQKAIGTTVRQKVLHCNIDETKSNTEKEIEKEIEKDKELLSEFSDRVNEIVDYLNQKASTSYRSSSKKTRDLIKARFNENFTVDDFKKVIDNKVLDWQGGEMAKYLRPETLFGNKFESYLNTPIVKKEGKKKVAEQATYKDQRKYNDDFYNGLEEKI